MGLAVNLQIKLQLTTLASDPNQKSLVIGVYV